MKVMMKELGEIITGNTPSKKTEEFWNSEDICFIKPDIIADNGINEIVDSNEYISEDARKKARVVGKNSIFITCIGNIGKLGIASDGEYAFNQQINAIIPNDRVQPKYLAYNLLFNKARLVAMANAPVVPIINKSQFGEFTVNIETDIDRQNETVDVLDKLTQIIQQRNKEISALDELIKARFIELFGDPKINDKSWDIGIISDYYEVKGGKRIPKGMGYTDAITTHPYLRASDMKNGTIIDDDIHYIDDEVYEHIKRYIVNGGDVYLTNVGVNLGMAGVIPDKYDGANLTENAVKLVPKKHNTIDGIFLSHYINSRGIQNYINERKMAVGVPKLAIFRIETMPILLPPPKLQKLFADFVHQVDKSKAAVQKALDETQLLFDSLMQEYFG